MSPHPTQSSRSARSTKSTTTPVAPASTTGPSSRHPVALRLPGQAAAHAGPIDLSMTYLMHHGFRRDLAAFAAAAHATPVGDREVWRALAGRWALFAALLHHHHNGEEAGLWPALAERSDSHARSVLLDMEVEHAEIDLMLKRSAAGFERLLVVPEFDHRVALAHDLEAVKATLDRHLDHEESDVIAIVQEVLTVSEWAAIEEEHDQRPVPLRQVLSLLAWVLHDVPASTRSDVLAGAGAGQRMIWTMTHGAFERRERRAFRYLD